MKIILINKENISTKDGREFVKVGFISTKDAKVGEIFTTKANYDSYKIDDDKYLSGVLLDKVVAEAEEADVEFDQRGRLVNLE
jgi:hypothetical protein